MTGNSEPWTAVEVNILRHCTTKKMSYAKMMQRLPGRSYSSIKEKRRRLDFPRRRYEGITGSLKLVIPATVMEERDRRANEYRTLSQVLMGDPPPSQSALGRHPGNNAD